MLHPSIEIQWINSETGYGLFAKEKIPAGTITWVQDPMDTTYTEEEIAKFSHHQKKQLFKYAYRNASGNYILCWDLGKFMNHNCNPNTLSPGLKIDIALQDIEKGEQVTTDYSTLNLEAPMRCSCGEENCRGTIIDEDFDRLIPLWDKRVETAFQQINEISQPLRPWLEEEEKKINHILENKDPIPSIGKHRYNPK